MSDRLILIGLWLGIVGCVTSVITKPSMYPGFDKD